QEGALLNLQGDNLATGNVILNPVVTVTFQGTLANLPFPAMTASTAGLTGGSPTIFIRTASPGGSNANAVQTISFEGNITDSAGSFFTITFNNGAASATTGNIAWSSDASILLTNIQNALNALPLVGGRGNVVAAFVDRVGIGAE